MEEFYGKLTMHVASDNQYHNGNTTSVGGKVKWVIRDDTKINQNVREIEDGDMLEVYDNMGRIVFSKRIITDYDMFYNPGLKKQLYKGTTVEWLPYGVDAGYWFNLFSNRHRARLVKKEEVDQS